MIVLPFFGDGIHRVPSDRITRLIILVIYSQRHSVNVAETVIFLSGRIVI